MIDFLLGPFLQNDFMALALGAGILVAGACGIVGSLVVLRGLAFLGDALAHGVLPGVALAMVLGLPGILGAALGAGAMIGGVTWIRSRTRLTPDTAIGLLFVGLLALGVVIISGTKSFTGDLVAILFGQFLGVSWGDLAFLVGALVLVGALAFLFRRPFLMLCFSEETTQAAGYSPRIYGGIMLFMIAFTVISAFQTVGTFLVFGMLLAPAAAGALISRSLGTMMAWAAGLGTLAVYAGLLISFYGGWAAGATVTLVAVAEFFLVLIFTEFRKKRGSHG